MKRIEHILHQGQEVVEKLVIEYMDDYAGLSQLGKQHRRKGIEISYWIKFKDAGWHQEPDAGAYIPSELLPQVEKMIATALGKE